MYRNNAKCSNIKQGKRKYTTKNETSNVFNKNVACQEKFEPISPTFSPTQSSWSRNRILNDDQARKNQCFSISQKENVNAHPAPFRQLRRSSRLNNKEECEYTKNDYMRQSSNFRIYNNGNNICPANQNFHVKLLNQMNNYIDVQTPLIQELHAEKEKLNLMLSGKTNLHRLISDKKACCSLEKVHEAKFSPLIPSSNWVYSTPKRQKDSSIRQIEPPLVAAERNKCSYQVIDFNTFRSSPKFKLDNIEVPLPKLLPQNCNSQFKTFWQTCNSELCKSDDPFAPCINTSNMLKQQIPTRPTVFNQWMSLKPEADIDVFQSDKSLNQNNCEDIFFAANPPMKTESVFF